VEGLKPKEVLQLLSLRGLTPNLMDAITLTW